MSFRKRNVGLAGASARLPAPAPTSTPSSSENPENNTSSPEPARAVQLPGIRPSPLDGRPTTSTGTASLDGLLAGHAGLATGASILLEETGTTDYAGTLLRFYAAEGIVQGHTVHVVGPGESWARELPGLALSSDLTEGSARAGGQEKMKIAWRYERLGDFGTAPKRERPQPSGSPSLGDLAHVDFCHSFDLTKRLSIPSPETVHFIPISRSSGGASPFPSIIQSLSRVISSTPATTVHRVVIPALLSPAFYPLSASLPSQVLQFLHALRSLLRQYSGRLTAMLSLPLSLYPRETGLTRWMELLSDGVIEMVPFPHSVDVGPSLSSSGAATAQEEKPQGMIKAHRLPVFHERGGGGLGLSDDMAFTISRRKFLIKPFSLPPLEGDAEAQKGQPHGTPSKAELDF